MKMRLPKMLAVALMSAMCAGVAYANAPQRHTPEAIITDSLDGIGSAGKVAKDGSGALSVIGNKSVSANLFVREGSVVVGDGATDTTLTITPPTPSYGSLIVAGKDAEVIFDKAVLDNNAAGFIRIGGYDGNGSLKLINGSKSTDDVELFTIGVNAMPASQVTAAPQCTTKGGSGSDAGEAYEGTYAAAKNGSGASFGRGDVLVSGGSELELSHASFWMGEGSLTVEGGSKATAGDTNRGFRTLLGLGENTTSDIVVKDGSELVVNARSEFSTNCSDNSSANITADGGKITVSAMGQNSAYLGASYNYQGVDTSAVVTVKNGGEINFNSKTTYFLRSESAAKGAELVVNVEDTGSAINFSSSTTEIHEGTIITNSGRLTATDAGGYFKIYGGEIQNKAGGAIDIKTKWSMYMDGGILRNEDGGTVTLATQNREVYIYGGELDNAEGGVIDAENMMMQIASMTGSATVPKVTNAGELSARTMEIKGSAIVENSGTIKTSESISIAGSASVTNSGAIDTGTSYTWLKGAGATLTMQDGGSIGRLFVSNGALVIDGDATMNGALSAFDSLESGASACIVFTDGSSLDMQQKKVTLNSGNLEVAIVLQVDGTVGQLTSLEEQEFFKNYSADSDLDANQEVLVVGSDGSVSVRKLGDINYGIVVSPSGNQRAVYDALMSMVQDGVASPELQALVSSQDPAALEAALNALSGHEYATAMSSQMEGNMAHLGRLRAAMGKGSALVPGAVADDGKGGQPTRLPLVAGVSVFQDESEVDGDAHGDGYDRTELGAMVNAECQVRDNLTLGGAISYGRTKLRTDGSMNRHEDNTRLDAYALYGKKRWSFATSLGLSLHQHELKRALGRDDVNGYAINFMQEAACTVYSNAAESVQVVGTVESSWNTMDNISDGMLYADDQSAWSTDVTVGVRYNRALRALGYAPAGVFTAQAGVTASIGDINPALEVGMGGYTWRQDCAKRNRWGWSLSAGVDVPVKTNVSVYAAGETVLRGDSNSVNGQIGVRVAF